MSDEDAFLRKILENPADDVTRLVYADWLQERDELAKSEFLRLTVEIDTVKNPPPKSLLQRLRLKSYDADPAKPTRVRLQQLAAKLEPKWLAVVSKITIDLCGQLTTVTLYSSENTHQQTIQLAPPVFEFECPKEWQHLDITEDEQIRFCNSCKRNVYYCDTIVVARDHAREGHCVAVDLGIRRQPGDTTPVRQGLVGILEMGAEVPEVEKSSTRLYWAARQIDTLSQERELAKEIEREKR